MVCEHEYVESNFKETCGKCGKIVYKPEIYSRVCGYIRPVSNWNDAKIEEFKDRSMFDQGTSDIYDAKV